MGEKNYYLYLHTCPNGKVYVGITCRHPNVRWENGKGYKHNEHFTRAINKYGWENIKHEILLSNLTKDEANEKETETIAFYQSDNPKYGYNLTKGGMLENWDGLNTSKLPSYDDILKNSYLREMFKSLIASCYPQEKIETITTCTYGKNDEIEKKK